jgi:hypothetical protein
MSFPTLTTKECIVAHFKTIQSSGLREFNSETKPTDVDVDQWISEATSWIYGALNEKYIIPVTDPCDLLILKSIADLYVVAKVREVIGTSAPRRLEGGKLLPVTNDLTEFFKRIEMLKKCKIQLVNTPTESAQLMSYSYNSSNNIFPIARKEIDQW